MTLDKLIYDVREALNDYTLDSEISNEYIEYLYAIKRSKYLEQSLSRGNTNIDESVQQTYCDNLEITSPEICGINLSCEKILKSKKKIPKLIDLTGKSALISVKPTNTLKRPFNLIDMNRVPFIEGSPIKNTIHTFRGPDSHLYLYSKNEDFLHLECVQITGVFDDPMELFNYKNCCNCEGNANKCFDPLTSEYPLQSYFIDIIREEIVNLLIHKKSIPEDRENDDNDTTLISNQGNER